MTKICLLIFDVRCVRRFHEHFTPARGSLIFISILMDAADNIEENLWTILPNAAKGLG